MSTQIVSTWTMLLIGLAACLVLTIALTYQGWSASSTGPSIAANCSGHSICGAEPPPGSPGSFS